MARSLIKHVQKLSKQKKAAGLLIRRSSTLRGICYIDPDDMKFKNSMKSARKKLEVPLESAKPRMFGTEHGKTCSIKTRLSEDKIRLYHRCPRVHENAHWKDLVKRS